MYRVINVNSREVLAETETIESARAAASESEQHETQPEAEIHMLLDGEWVKVN